MNDLRKPECQHPFCGDNCGEEPRGFLTEWEAAPLKLTEDAKMGNDEARTAALVAEAYEAAVEAIEALPRRQEPIGGQMVSYVQIAEAITAIRALAQKEAGE